MPRRGGIGILDLGGSRPRGSKRRLYRLGDNQTTWDPRWTVPSDSLSLEGYDGRTTNGGHGHGIYVRPWDERKRRTRWILRIIVKLVNKDTLHQDKLVEAVIATPYYEWNQQLIMPRLE